jgi:hypothetical protein
MDILTIVISAIIGIAAGFESQNRKAIFNLIKMQEASSI